MLAEVKRVAGNAECALFASILALNPNINELT